MRIGQRLTIGLGLVLSLALIGGVAAYLASTQASAGDRLRADFAHRAAVAADLTGSGLNASDARNREFAEHAYAGPESELAEALASEEDVQADFTLLLRADGTVLASYPLSVNEEESRRAVGDAAARAVKTDRIAFGDLPSDADPHQLVMAVPFATEHGTRVLVMSTSLEFIVTYVQGYLSSVLELDGGRAYIVDGHGMTLVTTDSESAAGQPLPAQGLIDAMRTAESGAVADDYFATGAVSNTNWRVVFVAPDRVLMEPIRSSGRVAWQLFAAFVVAMVCLLALGVTALSRSARLAYARMHDTLTGLPNRALFLDKAQSVLNQRRGGGLTAALFIDLDGFKPVNDRHGHAVGDALLVAVAERLSGTMRRGDVVSRFGGDEFLVLCANLTEEQEAMTIADRIRRILAEPFHVDGHEVSVGSSIGVATYDEGMGGSSELIHSADLAMYQAKQAGRGRIERFDRSMIPAGS